MEKNVLSKSSFIKGAQCIKQLYLSKHHAKLRDALTPERLAVFQRGSSVGILAQQLFPNGIDVGPKHPTQYRKAIQDTIDAMHFGKDVLYEAAFQSNKTLILLDILVKNGEGWDAYEVKSSQSLSETYFKDAALQYAILKDAGVNLNSFSLIHINPEYKYNGELVLSHLFKFQDVTSEVESRYIQIKEQISTFISALEKTEIPKISVGKHCFLPYDCDFQGHCWKEIAKPNIFDLPTLNLEEKDRLFNKNITIEQLSQNHLFSENQQNGAKVLVSKLAFKSINKNVSDKLEGAKLFLKLIIIKPAVPNIIGTKPYENIPIAIAFESLDNSSFQAIKFYETSNFTDIQLILNQLSKSFKIITLNQEIIGFDYFDLKNLLISGEYIHPEILFDTSNSSIAKALKIKPDWNGINHEIVANQMMEKLLFESLETEKKLDLTSKLENYLKRELLIIKTLYHSIF